MRSDLELPLKLPEPAVSVAEVEQLVAALGDLKNWQPEHEKRNGWATAAEIATHLDPEAAAIENGARWVRKVASVAAPAVVSFPGSRGYKLWQLCSVDEINHCIEAFESQGKDMLKRAILYRQAYHRRFRGTAS